MGWDVDRQSIERARTSDPAALREVLESAREPVWRLARGFTRDWDEAEDLAQEILIEVARSLPHLVDADRFPGWCTKLGRRVALRWSERRHRRQRLWAEALFDDVDPATAPHPFAAPDEALLAEEQRRELRAGLQRLGAESRRALQLFYLEGCSVAQIAERLGAATATVRQRLFAGRQQLRKDLENMPTTTEQRQRPCTRPILRFTSWGSWSGSMSEQIPWILVRTLLAQQVLVQIAKQPHTATEICAAVGADAVYVRDHLEAMIDAELVRLEGTDSAGQDRYLADFFIFDAPLCQALHDQGKAIGRRDAEIIAERLGALQQAFTASDWRDDVPWEEARWLLVPGFVLSMGGRHAHSEVFEIDPPVRPDGNNWYFHGWSAEAPRLPWSLGCTRIGMGEGVGAGAVVTGDAGAQLPGPTKRPLVRVLLDGPCSADELIRRADDGERARTDLAELIGDGFCTRKGDQIRLAIPVLTEAVDACLYPVVRDLSRELVERSRLAGIAELEATVRDAGYDHLGNQWTVLRAFLGSSIAQHTYGAVLGLGLLGAVPKDPAPAFATWLWRGHRRLLSGEAAGGSPSGTEVLR